MQELKSSVAAAFVLQLTWAVAVPPTAARADDPGLALRVAKVVTMDDAETVINDAVVLISGGKIAAVGPAAAIEIPAGYRVRDYSEHWLVPGLIDAHNHTAGTRGDINDMVYLANPGLDTRSALEPENAGIKRARTGGVTTVLFIPGSGTNISGFGTISKTAGKLPDDVVVRSPGSLKIAQSGNPEWYFGGARRMFMNWNTRQSLLKAKDYHERWTAFEQGAAESEPQFDPLYDKLRGLFRREYPVSVHTQGYQVLMTTVDMVANKLGIWTVLDHCTFDAWKVGPLVSESDCWTINGPRQYQLDRSARRLIGNASGWWKNGVRKLGLNTDAPVVPQAWLHYQGTMACWYGWLPYPALKGITRIPAQALGIDDRVGSIEVGKDADFGIWTGDPLDPRSACLLTVVDGRVAYDASKDRRSY